MKQVEQLPSKTAGQLSSLRADKLRKYLQRSSLWPHGRSWRQLEQVRCKEVEGGGGLLMFGGKQITVQLPSLTNQLRPKIIRQQISLTHLKCNNHK